MADHVSEIGKKIFCEEHRGVIKFYGEVPPTKGVWYGVEWEDETRGKHDGSHDGVQYFSCSHPTGGSFVRPNKVEFGIDIIEALNRRYGTSNMEINQKELFVVGNDSKQTTSVEAVGFEKIVQKQSAFSNLREVFLKDMAICGTNDTRLHCVAPGITTLDLSNNLLSSWEQVAEITTGLEHLTLLKVDENILMLPAQPESLQKAFQTVTDLYLNRMRLKWCEVETIIKMFQNVHSVFVCHNGINSLRGDEEEEFLRNFQEIQIINLEGNQISSWEDIAKFAKLPKLQMLILNNNSIDGIILSNSGFSSLQSISLSKNSISEWKSINELNRLLALKELRIADCPLFKDETTFQIRQDIIPRIEKLQKLNGSPITVKERTAAEKAYIQKYSKDFITSGGKLGDDGEVDKENIQAEFLLCHPMYLELVKVHGPPMNDELVVKTMKETLLSITIMCPDREDKKSISKKLPGTMTVQKIKGLLQRLYKIDSSDQKLSYVDSKGGHEIELEDDLKPLSFYSVQTGDKILLRW